MKEKPMGLMLSVLMLCLGGPVMQYAPDCNLAMSTAPDYDGDQVDDLLIGDSSAFDQKGQVWLVSGANGAVLVHRIGESKGIGFGNSIVAVGDIDGDHRRDLAIWCVGSNSIPSKLLVLNSSGEKTLLSIEGWTVSTSIEAIGSIANPQGDGVEELFLADAQDGDGQYRSGRVRVCSGRTGKTLRSVKGRDAQEHLGTSAIAIEDLDGDGASDMIISSVRTYWPLSTAQPTRQIAHVADRCIALSGRDLHQLYEVRETSEGSRFGASLVALGDIDKDGISDFAVGAPAGDDDGAQSASSYVGVYSGKKGELLKTIQGGRGTEFGSALVALRGTPQGMSSVELIIGSPYGGKALCGEVVIYSSSDWSMVRRIEGGNSDEHFGCGLAVMQGHATDARKSLLAVRACRRVDDRLLREIRVLDVSTAKKEYTLAIGENLVRE